MFIKTLIFINFATMLIASPVYAEIIHFKAELTSRNEVPPAKGSHGKGHLRARYDTTTKTLTWNNSHSGLTGPATAAHFHGPATKTENAGVIIPVEATELGHKGKGKTILTDEQAIQLINGQWYFNYHTAKFPGGEIRGQVIRAKK